MTTYKQVMGIKADGDFSFTNKQLTVRFTSDEIGESLSISDDESVMLNIPFEGIEEIIAEARKGSD